MKKKGHFLAAAAMAGLLSGTAVHQARADDSTSATSTNSPPGKVAPGKIAPARKEPKLQDCGGSNDCKGLGGCKSGDNGCKFKNTCKGKGGCSITAEDIQKWRASQTNSVPSIKG